MSTPQVTFLSTRNREIPVQHWIVVPFGGFVVPSLITSSPVCKNICRAQLQCVFWLPNIIFLSICRISDVLRSGVPDLILAASFPWLSAGMIVCCIIRLELYDERKYSSFDGYAKDLLCVLDHLHVKRTIYVGHSMSAMVGCVAATYRPQLFHHLVLLNASPRYLNGEGYIGGFEKPQVDELLKEMDKNFTKWAKQFAPFAVMVNNSKAMTEVEHSLGRMNPKIALTVAKMVFLSDLTKLLPKVKTSTSIILTKKDNIVPKSVAFFIKSNIGGNSNVNILKSQGHFPQLTAFPQLLKVLTKVLQLKQYKIINN